jgi:23S rRNA (uracil1939-C5)-methyltransferase
MALAEVEELELTIEKLVAGGDGLGRHQGVPIFVPLTAPGDRARVRIVERRPDFGRGVLVELISPGPGRRQPPCPHFADCGGCDLQHLDDQLQVRLKVEAAIETLRRIGGCELPAPAEVLLGSSWGYRLRTQLHLAAGAKGVEVGYLARRSRRLVPIRSCAVLAPALERAALDLAGEVASPLPSRVDLALGDDGSVAAAPPAGGIAGGELVRRVGEFDYHFDARCFFQAHATLTPRLVEVVVGEARGESALDLYGGVGLFALPLGRRYSRVTLVEGDRIASRYARRNAQAAGLAGVETVARAVETWIATGLPDSGLDRVVVDPPRDGLPVVVRRLLVARPVARLTYVSCHPAALARDLRDLREAYDIDSLVFADLFPQTGHLETIVQMVRRRTP